MDDTRRPPDPTTDSDAFGPWFDGLPEAILIANDDGDYVYANPAASELLRRPASELLSLSIRDVAAPGEDFETQWKAFKGSGSMTGQFTLLTGDGDTVPADFTAVVNYRPGRHLSVLHDMSERRRIEDILRHNEERFVRAFVGSPAPTNIRALSTGVFVEVNDAFTETTGYWRSDVIGRTAKDLGLWPDTSLLDSLLQRLSQGETRADAQVKLRMKDGSLREFRVALRKLDMHGEPHVVAVYYDLDTLM